MCKFKKENKDGRLYGLCVIAVLKFAHIIIIIIIIIIFINSNWFKTAI